MPSCSSAYLCHYFNTDQKARNVEIKLSLFRNMKGPNQQNIKKPQPSSSSPRGRAHLVPIYSIFQCSMLWFSQWPVWLEVANSKGLLTRKGKNYRTQNLSGFTHQTLRKFSLNTKTKMTQFEHGIFHLAN